MEQHIQHQAKRSKRLMNHPARLRKVRGIATSKLARRMKSSGGNMATMMNMNRVKSRIRRRLWR
jgi:hypothetical protein